MTNQRLRENFFQFRGAMPAEEALRWQRMLNDEGYTGLMAAECDDGRLDGFPLLNLDEHYRSFGSLPEKQTAFRSEVLLGLAHYCASLGIRNVHVDSVEGTVFSPNGILGGIRSCSAPGELVDGFYLFVRSGAYLGMEQLLRPHQGSRRYCTLSQEVGMELNPKDLAEKIPGYLSFLFSNGGVSEFSQASGPYDLAKTIAQTGVEHFLQRRV